MTIDQAIIATPSQLRRNLTLPVGVYHVKFLMTPILSYNLQIKKFSISCQQHENISVPAKAATRNVGVLLDF